MRKLMIASATVLITLALMLIFVMLTLQTRWFSDYLSNRMTDQLGRQVQWSDGLQVDWSLQPTLRIDNLHVANADWAGDAPMISVDSVTAQVDLTEIPYGVLEIEELRLSKPNLRLSHSQRHGANWQPLVGGRNGKTLLEPRFRKILLDDGSIRFSAPERNTLLSAEIDTGKGQRLRIQGKGRLLDRPITLTITGDPVQQAVAGILREQTAYDLHGKLHWREHSLSLDGHTRALTELKRTQFDLKLQGPNADALAQLFGYRTRAAPYRLQTTVQYHERRWSFSDIDAHLGDSELQGALSYQSGAPRPTFSADLRLTSLNITKTLPRVEPTDKQRTWPQRINQWQTSLPDLNADLNLRLDRFDVQGVTLRDLQIQAELQPEQLNVQPLEFKTAGGDVTATASLDLAGKIPQGKIAVHIQHVDLGQALAPVGYQKLSQLDGELGLRWQQDALVVTDSELRYRQRDRQTDLTLQLQPRQTARNSPGVQADATGHLHGESLALTFQGGPLLDLDNPHRPYPLTAQLTFGDTQISAEGTMTQPLRLRDIDLQLKASGTDPANLWHLTPIAFPHLPPYDVAAHLLRRNDKWQLRNIRGEIGDSDLSGSLAWRHSAGQRPKVWADLRAKLLDLDDLAPVIGGAPATGPEETSSPQQERLARKREQRDELLPEGELLRKRLQALDAEVELSAQQFRAAAIPFDALTLQLHLNNGKLRLEPLAFKLGAGQIKLQLTLDTSPMPASGSAKLKVARVNLNQLLTPFEIANDTQGIIGGTGTFHISGDSVSAALASLQGDMRLLMENGQLDALLVEAAGVDFGEALITLWGEQPDPVALQCLYLDMSAAKGVLETTTFTLATSDSNIIGNGQVNFAKEQYELTLEARPKDFSLLSGSSPIRLYGDFTDFNIDVISKELLGRTALAAIGAAVFPPAALLPLITPGTTSGQAGCRQQVAAVKN